MNVNWDRVSKCFVSLFFVLLVGGISPLGAAAEEVSKRPLRVAICPDEPFAEKSPTGGYKGYVIDIWEQIAAQNGWKYEYVELPSVADFLDAIAQGRVDIGASNITITKARLAQVDFSLPCMDAGLLIMVNDKNKTVSNQIWKVISHPDHLRMMALGSMMIFAAAFIVTLFERRLNLEFPKGWIEGGAESFYHVMSVLFTGKTNHKGIPGPMGRFFAGIWLATGVAVVAFITSSITSSMTVNKLNEGINGPQDLPGKTVGTNRGTVGQTYCENCQLTTRLFDNVKEAVHALVAREIDCIVYDAPVLLYYDKSHPELPISEVGPVINKAPYAFVFPQASSLRKPFNLALYHLDDKGVLKKLYDQYFGSN